MCEYLEPELAWHFTQLGLVAGSAFVRGAFTPEDDIFLALAKHIPALSSPVGGRAALGQYHDFDLNDGEYRNNWGRIHPVFGGAWLHSDMKDMAYFYVYKLYDQLVEKGSLR